MTDLEALIAKLEAAEKGSRELDAEIAVAIFDEAVAKDDLIYAKLPHPRYDDCAPGTFWRHSRSGASLHTAPRYTTSLDAALTLVPEGWWADVFTPIGVNPAQGNLWTGEPPYYQDQETEGFAPTPVLALCIAALKARRSSQKPAAQNASGS